MIVGLAGGCATTLSPELMVPNAPAAAVRRTEWTITVAPVTSEGKTNTVALAAITDARAVARDY